jgi:hypothetical protein
MDLTCISPEVNEAYDAYSLDSRAPELQNESRLRELLVRVEQEVACDVELSAKGVLFVIRDGFDFSEQGFRKIFDMVEAVNRFDT